MQLPAGKVRRLIFVISGATDALIGVAILIFGFGLLPVDFLPDDLPNGLFILIGGVMFVAGVWVAVYNFSRFEE